MAEHKSKQMLKRKLASSLRVIKSCLDRISERVDVLLLKVQSCKLKKH